MLSSRTQLFLLGTLALLPLLGLAALLWRRFYREDSDNAAQRVLKNSSLPIAANLVNRVIDFGFAAVMLRFLGPAGNGDYALAALVAAQYFLTISNWGLNDLSVREAAADHTQAARLWSITLALRCIIAAALLPVAAVLVGIYALLGTPLSGAAVGALILLMIHLFPAALASACSASFQAFQRMEIPAVVALLTNIARVLIGTLVFVAGGRVVALAGVALATTLLNAVLFFWFQQRLLFPARWEWDGAAARVLLREAFPLLLNSLLLVVFFRFDVLILRAVSGAAAVGTYDTSYKLINMTTIIPAYFVAALFPMLARHAVTDRAALLRVYRHAVGLLQLIAWPVAVGVMVLARDLILLLAGTAFLPGAALALAVLIWYLPLSYLNGVTQYVLIAVRRQHAITVAFGIAAVFNLGGNLLLIPRYGYGAAAALTIATELVILLSFVRVLRAEGVLLPFVELCGRPALAAALMGVAMALVLPWSALAAALLAPFVYGAALWLVGAFGAEERALVRRVLGRTS